MASEQAQSCQSLTKKQRDKFAEMVKAGSSPAAMQIATGCHESLIKRILPEICEEYGLQYTPEPKGKFQSPYTPEIAVETRRVRAKLGAWLQTYRDAFHPPLQPVQVSNVTGLTRREATRAMHAPWEHDWTLIQLSRFAAALGLSTEAFLDRLANWPSTKFINPREENFVHPDKTNNDG